MKKIFTVILAAGVTGSGYAQALLEGNSIVTESFREGQPPVFSPAAGGNTDTLGLSEFLETNFGLYGLGNGYATGMSHNVTAITQPVTGNLTNQFHAFAEGYVVNTNYTVLGAVFLAGVSSSQSGDNPDIEVSVHLIEDNKAFSNPATVQAADIPGPGDALATATIPLADVTTLLPNIVEFSTPPSVTGDFCVSVNIAGVYDGTPMDTLAIFSTENGAGDDMYTFHNIYQKLANPSGVELFSANLWAPTSAVVTVSSVGVNVNLGIFPIVEEDISIGIEEAGFINGVNLTTYPNPALSSDNVRIDYTLETAAKAVVLNVFDMNGRVIWTAEEGSRSNGIHAVNVPSGLLSSGSYIYSITADDKRVAKRMQVLK